MFPIISVILMEKVGVSVYFFVPFLLLGYCRCVIRRLKGNYGIWKLPVSFKSALMKQDWFWFWSVWMKHVKTETGGSLVVWNDEYKGRFIAFWHRFDAGQQWIEKEKEKEENRRKRTGRRQERRREIYN